MEKKDIASYSFEELQEEMLAIGEKDSAVDRFIPGSMKSWWMILKK